MPEGAEETTEECIARGELRNSTAGEYLISGFDAEYGGVERNVYFAGQNFKTWLPQFLQYANLVHIKPSDRRAYLLTLLEQLANKVVELLKFSESLTFEEFTSKLVERFYPGKTREDYKLQLRAKCQRPNEDFEGFANNVMELVADAYPEAVYSFKVELARD